MPGLAFERTGERLGRGGGFYDAFLERYFKRCDAEKWTRPPAVALAYETQILAPERVPTGSADYKVDALVTAGDGITVCTPEGKRAFRS
jgi:5-formyltetrahydrofolate cyclo-ligase